MAPPPFDPSNPPPGMDNLVGGQPGISPGPTTDDLVNHDPVVAALIATGQPLQMPLPVARPGVQPVAAGGPITSPDQVPAADGPVTSPSAPPPTTPATANPAAAYTPVATDPALRDGDVKGAVAAQNADLNAATKDVVAGELAKVDALAQHADARAKIYEGHAQAQQLVDEQYQRAREKARMDANAETAAWMRDLDKKVAEEPVPGRWWANQNKFGQTMYLLSLAFGAMAQAKNPNLKNIALEMITKETDDDVAEQRDRIKRQVEAMKMKGQMIDQRLQAQIADAKDDHGLLVSRLAMVQQAALERANAPGSADVKAAMAEAAQWAGQQRLVIAGERANRAYAEREAQLGRDAENGRAMLTDKRDRDIAAATIQKDYDLARIQAGVKLSAKEDPRMKDAVVLNPDVTGIRVVDDAGNPVATPLSSNGGLTVSKANEKEARQTSEVAAEKYAAMRRVSEALGKDENINVILKRNPQLISDIVKLGYGSARTELDPNGRVTDKDFVAGLEHELGGDLETLSGRVASATFSADQSKLKELVDKHMRDYPAFVSHKLGSLLDAAIPGYEGKVRVDWTPKSVEIDKPVEPSSRQIDATYGIHSELKPPETIKDLENAQKLEAGGVEALPPYKPGSRDKVLKALEDFKGASPDTIEKRAGVVLKQLSATNDRRAGLEVQQGMEKAKAKAYVQIDDFTDALKHTAEIGHDGWYTSTGKVDLTEATKLAKKYGLGQMTGQEITDLIKAVGLAPKE